MRPQILNPLFADITVLRGIGARLAKLIGKLCGPRVVDLLWHLPTGLIDRGYAPPVAEARHGVVATLTVRVDEHVAPRNRRQPYKVYCSDDSGTLCIVFFHAKPDYLQRLLPVGETRVVSGTVESYGDEVQMTHPDHVLSPDDAKELPPIEPVYPLTGGISGRVLGRVIRQALQRVPVVPEWLDAAHLAREGWSAWNDSVNHAHAPAGLADLEPDALCRRRLAYDELLANQLALGLVRQHMRRTAGRSIVGDGRLRGKAETALPFDLTGSQRQAIEEILADMASKNRMLRLLQGDVGSGKTVVALMAMLNAVEAGAQAALMAPTEILARQHLKTIESFAEATGARCALLTGRDKGKSRQALLSALASGEIDILIGTHAVFQNQVEFHDLALAVIDEQHKFGVHQRLSLQAKGREAVDVLVMTATPIPRTLTLTAYGDMDASRLTEKPAGRGSIATVVLPLDRIAEVVDAVDRAIRDDNRVYWVCPLVEESETVDLAAAEERFQALAARFPDKVGLVHGRIKGPARDAVMTDFAEGRISILVSTTVIEVGVDVSEATVMVVEQAERFGLAQLHQLRGRVGRGHRASTCILVYAPPLSETARARLAILRETDDGFRIAEEDLRLRGAGELLGTRQSGMPQFKLADLAGHADLMPVAHDDAKLILNRDPHLESERGEALRILLYLFERDAAISFLRSG